MKKLLSLILTIAMISTILVSTTLTVGAASSAWGSDFEDKTNTVINPSTSNANASVVENPDDNVGGYVFQSEVTADGGVMNADTKNMTISNTGVWVFQTDVYLPNDFPDGTILSIFPYAATDGSAPDILRLGDDNRKSTSLPNFPLDRWVTVKYVFDFSSGSTCATQIWLIDGNNEYLVRQVNVDKYATSGISKVRFQTHTVPANTRFYLDNLKCWQVCETLNVRTLSSEAKVHYNENFENVLYDFAASSTNFGNLYINTLANTTNGFVKTIADPTNSGKGNVLHYKSGNDGDSGKRLQLRTYGAFPVAITGTQIFDMDLYVPAQTTTNSLEDIVISFKNSAGTNGIQVRLGLIDGYAGSVSSAPIGAVTNAPIDEWFTIRCIMNYNSDIAEIHLIRNSGTAVINAKAMDSRLVGTGLSSIEISRSEKENTEFYVDNIAYYESDNMPTTIDFNRYTSIATSSDFVIGTAGAAKYAVVDSPTDMSYGKVMKLSQAAITAEENTASQNIVNFDTRLDPIGFGSGITVLSADMYIPEFSGDGISVSMAAFTDDREISTTQGDTTKYTSYGTPVGKSLKFDEDSVCVGGTDTGIAYPVGEWFTAYGSCNIENGTYSYYLKKADGTIITIADSLTDMSADAKAEIAKNGVKRARIQFVTSTGVAHDAVECYVDNIKFNNGIYGEIALNDAGTYTVSVDYVAQGEVVTNTKLVLAQYNASNELLTINMYTPVFSDGTGTYKVENIAKAEGATKVKLMYVDSVGSMYPLATSIEK